MRRFIYSLIILFSLLEIFICFILINQPIYTSNNDKILGTEIHSISNTSKINSKSLDHINYTHNSILDTTSNTSNQAEIDDDSNNKMIYSNEGTYGTDDFSNTQSLHQYEKENENSNAFEVETAPNTEDYFTTQDLASEHESVAEQEPQNNLETTMVPNNIIDWSIYPQNSLIIGDVVIPLYIGEATQYNVDIYDVVQDNLLFSSAYSIVCFGHSSRSLKILSYVEKGEKIFLINNGIVKEYEVFISEDCKVTDDKKDIINDNGESLLYDSFGYSSTLRLVTCYLNEFQENGRWVVIATELP